MRALLIALVASAACVTPSSEFPCSVDADCSGGRCEPDTKFCSFTDGACPSGSRYGDGAGALSNECVDGGVPVTCGNGMVDPGEDCDDTSVYCVACKTATCGDGQTLANIEECDDGNTSDGDGCNANCLICPTGSVTHDGHCYWAVTTPQTWDLAAADCTTNKGYLAAISDDAENTFVKGLTNGTDDYWIGIADFDQSAVNFFREDDFRAAFFKWGAAEPSTGLGEQAAAMHGTDGNWDHQTRATTHPYICEREGWNLEPTTHHAYLQLTGRARGNYAAEQAKCAGLPGAPHMVSITDQAEQTFVDGITGATQAYIGLDDITTEGSYVWNSGEPFSFFNWGTGEPTGAADVAQDAVVIREDGTWADRDPVNSFASHGAICELEPQ